MKSFAERDPRIIAVLGFAGIALLLAGVLNIDKLPGIGAGDTYRAAFTDASGLHEGEVVTVAGVKVGTVEEIDLAGDHVVVGFTVSGTTLPDATRASIEIKTLLGSHYLALHPAGRGELPEGSEILLSRTSTPLNIVPALAEATQTIERLDTERLGAAFTALAEVLRDTAPETRDTLAGLSALSKSITKRDSELKTLFRRSRAVTGVVAARDREITELVADTGTVLGVLRDRRNTIRALLEGTTALSTQVSGLVRDNAKQLGPTLHKLNQVLAVLKANDKQLDQALTQLATYVRIFNNALGTGEFFDSVITMPRGFAACGNPEGPLAGLLDPVLSEVNRRANGSGKPCLPLGAAADTDTPRGGR
jgi:phospholipid/cholesterol/gamma-HCH transport system substrate-binding protein